MGTVLPEGESVRRAVRFVSDALRDDPDQPLAGLVQRAALQFDLDPLQTDWLIRFYQSAREQ